MTELRTETFVVELWDGFDVPSAYEAIRTQVRTVDSVLLAAIDSEPQPARTTTGQSLIESGSCFAVAGGGLVFTVQAFETFMDNAQLHGFDEIWLFEALPPNLSNCPVSIATDHPLRPAIAVDLPTWFVESRPLVGLGDGIGLHLVQSNDQLLRIDSARIDT